MNKYLQKAIEVANKSTRTDHKVGAVITDRKGKIISTGFNVSKTHPKQKEYANKVGEYNKEYLHAEIHSLVRCNGVPHRIYVARVIRSGIGLAKPCEICSLAIKEAGITIVEYTK